MNRKVFESGFAALNENGAPKTILAEMPGRAGVLLARNGRALYRDISGAGLLIEHPGGKAFFFPYETIRALAAEY
jgi:hypothetical protein